MFAAEMALPTVDKVAMQYLCALQIVRLHWKITLSTHCVVFFFCCSLPFPLLPEWG